MRKRAHAHRCTHLRIDGRYVNLLQAVVQRAALAVLLSHPVRVLCAIRGAKLVRVSCRVAERTSGVRLPSSTFCRSRWLERNVGAAVGRSWSRTRCARFSTLKRRALRATIDVTAPIVGSVDGSGGVRFVGAPRDCVLQSAMKCNVMIDRCDSSCPADIEGYVRHVCGHVPSIRMRLEPSRRDVTNRSHWNDPTGCARFASRRSTNQLLSAHALKGSVRQRMRTDRSSAQRARANPPVSGRFACFVCWS